jgi:hypothetical protein
VPVATHYRMSEHGGWLPLGRGIHVQSNELHGETVSERAACIHRHGLSAQGLWFPDGGEDGRGGVWDVDHGWRSRDLYQWGPAPEPGNQT